MSRKESFLVPAFGAISSAPYLYDMGRTGIPVERDLGPVPRPLQRVVLLGLRLVVLRLESGLDEAHEGLVQLADARVAGERDMRKLARRPQGRQQVEAGQRVTVDRTFLRTPLVTVP